MGRWTGSGISRPFGLRYKRCWAETNKLETLAKSLKISWVKRIYKSDGRWVNLYRGVVREKLNQQLWNLDNKSLKAYSMRIDK